MKRLIQLLRFCFVTHQTFLPFDEAVARVVSVIASGSDGRADGNASETS